MDTVKHQACNGQCPPSSNTGGKPAKNPSLSAACQVAKTVVSRLDTENTATIVDTLSLVFPVRALVADWEAITVEVDKRPLDHREALRLDRGRQVELAEEWFSSRGKQRPFSDDLLIKGWVNSLWRLSMSGTKKRSSDYRLESAIAEVEAAFDFQLGALGLMLSPCGGGKNGFKYGATLVPDGWDFFTHGNPPSLGHVAWGGIFNKGGVELAQIHFTGEGCMHVGMCQGWSIVHGFAKTHAAHISRIDVAYDDFQGVWGTPSGAWLERYWDDAFTMRKRPSHTPIFGDGGHTLNIGKRENGKMLRIYQKGIHLGDEDSKWVRIELELHNGERDIPLDVLLEPDSYFAGSYPCLSEVVDRAEPASVPWVVKQRAAASARSLIRYCSESYGKLIDVLVRLGMSATDIVEKLRVSGVPARLMAPTFVAGLDAFTALPDAAG